MKIKNHETFSLFIPENESLEEIISFLSKNISDKNIALDLLKNKRFLLEDLLLFLEISNKHRSENHSFVLINNNINPNDIPDEIVVVPTMQEAEDIIEMEEIERELGF